MKLKNIATIQPGYSFRGAVIPDSNGSMTVFQAKDLVRDEPLTTSTSLVKIAALEVKETLHLKYNDIVIVARGLKAGAFRATTIKTSDENIVASSSVHIIRVNSSSIEADYVSHYLNSNLAQNELAKEVKGSYIGVLPRRAVEELEIPLPSLQKQKMLIELHANLLAQTKISIERNSIIHTMIDTIYKELKTL